MSRRAIPGVSRVTDHPLTGITNASTPVPSWSPSKSGEHWRKSSRWQACVPRSRIMIRVFMAATVVLVLCKFGGLLPEDLKPHLWPAKGSHAGSIRTEHWAWKDFPLHDGLTRGLWHFRTCSDDGQCVNKPPRMTQYNGSSSPRDDLSVVVHCVGPRGKLLNESLEDAVWAYTGKAEGAVEPCIGSYEASGLDGSISFDRAGRFQAYGIDQFDTTDEYVARSTHDVDWDKINWGSLQIVCVAANMHRFRSDAGQDSDAFEYPPRHSGTTNSHSTLRHTEVTTDIKRTAILIRAWTGAIWSADVVINIRAMVAEASLASGGKYQVFILLHVKEDGVALFTGENQPQETIRKHVPPEFHSITYVWDHAQIRALYSNIAEHAFMGRSPWMIVQWFARNHPQFDFFYQWEFDVRYTGHYLDFFEAVDNFGRNQPRKGAWERAGRLYIPLLHGAYETDFRERVREEDPHRVWGSVAVEGVRPRGPKPPHRQDDDNYEWGVGEDADWIGFLPSFNVTGTNWWFKDYLWGYTQGTATPRRATLIAQGRVSRRVLDIMNYENSENGHHMDAEMFPQTVCLHHGLKSTSFPHPIYADRYWPAAQLAAVFNGGPYGQSGGFWNSTFSKWNEDAWSNLTWYYSSTQAKPIYQRFLGIAASDGGGAEWEEANGRVVLRPMLLHPVKGAKSWHWTPRGWRQTKSGA